MTRKLWFRRCLLGVAGAAVVGAGVAAAQGLWALCAVMAAVRGWAMYAHTTACLQLVYDAVRDVERDHPEATRKIRVASGVFLGPPVSDRIRPTGGSR